MSGFCCYRNTTQGRKVDLYYFLFCQYAAACKYCGAQNAFDATFERMLRPPTYALHLLLNKTWRKQVKIMFTSRLILNIPSGPCMNILPYKCAANTKLGNICGFISVHIDFSLFAGPSAVRIVNVFTHAWNEVGMTLTGLTLHRGGRGFQCYRA